MGTPPQVPPSDLAGEGGTSAGGKYPALGTPIRPDQGYHTLGTPCRTLAGVPIPGVPHIRYPLGPGQGYPYRKYPTSGAPVILGVPWPGGTPPQVPPIGPGQGGGTPAREAPHLRYPLSDLAGRYSCQGEPTLGTPIGPDWRYPYQGGTSPQVPPWTWPGGTPAGGTPPWVPLLSDLARGGYQGVPHLR